MLFYCNYIAMHRKSAMHRIKCQESDMRKRFYISTLLIASICLISPSTTHAVPGGNCNVNSITDGTWFPNQAIGGANPANNQVFIVIAGTYTLSSNYNNPLVQVTVQYPNGGNWVTFPNYPANFACTAIANTCGGTYGSPSPTVSANQYPLTSIPVVRCKCILLGN